ncbi:MAG: hypothetical protein K6E91_11035 [Butyrivibrio sp.]|nr:hypothetical protein [Butyrivibrio sp.]
MDKMKIGIVLGILLAFLATPAGVVLVNSYNSNMQRTDDLTNYKTKKEVEDSCRALMVSYQNDRLIWEQYKDSEKLEEITWANSAKMRANKAAVTYNEYFLKNRYVFKNNIPEDLREELEILK